jgi:hypothetical protein
MCPAAYGKKIEKYLPPTKEDPFLNILHTTFIDGNSIVVKGHFHASWCKNIWMSVSVKVYGSYAHKGDRSCS